MKDGGSTNYIRAFILVDFVLWSVNDMQGMKENISANNGGLGCIIFDMLKKG
jgi:hypothetical protein